MNDYLYNKMLSVSIMASSMYLRSERPLAVQDVGNRMKEYMQVASGVYDKILSSEIESGE